MFKVRSKVCHHCQATIEVAFRIRQAKNQDWIFVCESCCKKAGQLPEYQYGGTWKGKKK